MDLPTVFATIGSTLPSALVNWDDAVEDFIACYEERFGPSEVSTINVDSAFFLFDHGFERVVLAYALSTEQLTKRDSARMRGFPNVNSSVRRVLGDKAFVADKGHFLGHASGGILDINLFPQRRELNRGWSGEGKRFRSMERHVAEHPGTFFYHRPIYDDDTWIPSKLEYAVLRGGSSWWKDMFFNK
ncbi:DNA/RNA non-specific endonuclease [Dechloromonas denitrificans]|uniref:DNA/RNA non-specific endonuclease n=1 Tax=Dechloromonas denitrificans TaxID=281362 RepID=UPI001CF8884B|nr:DNA/RNA non-specific endonuclease [Dechloromonas denitrificans]UCV01700.1 hypothetical protein KI611_11235 [Dechloromonas denitrificans]UCV06068.1 hypothetical protein KI615_11485 [Dechloromonas denitrificans]